MAIDNRFYRARKGAKQNKDPIFHPRGRGLDATLTAHFLSRFPESKVVQNEDRLRFLVKAVVNLSFGVVEPQASRKQAANASKCKSRRAASPQIATAQPHNRNLSRRTANTATLLPGM